MRGVVLTFDPADAEGTLETYAWGFRNLLGLAWDPESGEMYAAQNGYDVRGARPVNDEHDPVYRVRQGTWYGVPDFSAALEPLTDDRFEPPDEHQAMVLVEGEEQGKDLDFLIDHDASGLTPPDPSLVLSLHPINSSPSMIDVAPASWGDLAGHVLVAEWGDLAPPTNPLRGKEPAGSRVVSVDPESGEVTPFVWNAQPGPASMNGQQGTAFDHPFEVEFGPDGALYIVDYGVVEIDESLKDLGKPPYREVPGTGVIWKVTQTTAGEAQEPAADQKSAAAQEGETEPTVSEATGAAAIETAGASQDGKVVTIPSVNIPEPGFLVIHTVLDGQPVAPESIGHVALNPGTSNDVQVTLDYPPAPGESYAAMLHRDTNGNGTYDFGPGSNDVDGPLTRTVSR